MMKPRTITLNLTDDDCLELATMAGKAGLTISELMEAFISDLTGNDRSHGSDERNIAGQWFDRCFCGGLQEDTFLYYLLDGLLFDYFLTHYKIMEDYEADLKAGLDTEEERTIAQEEIAYQKEQLQELYDDYAAGQGKKEPYDKALERVLQYRHIYNAAKRGTLI